MSTLRKLALAISMIFGFALLAAAPAAASGTDASKDKGG